MDTSFVAEWATLVKQSYFLNFIYIHNLDRNKVASPTDSIFRNWTEMPENVSFVNEHRFKRDLNMAFRGFLTL